MTNIRSAAAPQPEAPKAEAPKSEANAKPEAAKPVLPAEAPQPEAAKPEAPKADAKPADSAKEAAKAEAEKVAAQEAAKAEAERAAREAMFANLPRIKLAETADVLDLSGVQGNDPYKYAELHASSVAKKLPVAENWAHATAVFVIGTNKGGENGFKPGSVYGTIADIVSRAGKAGIAAHELVTQVRIRQIGNKRSKYCTALPPVGWVEGWLRSAIAKNIVGIHPTKRAPALTVAPAGEPATPEQNAAAKAIAAQPGKGGDAKAAKAA